MSIPVTFFGAMCSGHSGFPPRPNVQASPDVFVNGIGVQRFGDAYSVHCKPSHGCHPSNLSSGSGSVFVNGKPIGRIGDSIGCGSVVSTGSSNVFAGG
jgi:uncharacterized Zn-binding protein involved in type VI secretion